MINQDIIAQDLFYKIRSRFPKMEMGDQDGQATFEAAKGRFFDFDAIFNETNLGSVSISINEPGSLKLYFNRNILEDADDITSKTWFNFLKEMRKFSMKRLMSFDTRDISKSNLDKRDYGYLAKKGPVMSESMMKGTSRTSYRPLEALQRSRLIIRHSKPVDESIPGARSRNLESLFIENAAGERFKYPFKHLAGAKAMQRHVANEGYPHDAIGQRIIKMSEDMAKLANFKHYVYREDLMNSETNHIVGRANEKLQHLKELMNRISLQHHYEAFKAKCEGDRSIGGDQNLIDDFTLEDYKEKFTVKSFKEDIAEVFPLLYSIMQEDNELDLEEVAKVEDTTEDLDLESVVAESPETQFHAWATTLIETRMTPDEIARLQGLLSEHFPVGLNGDNVSATLEELGLEVPEDTKMALAQLAEASGPDADAKSLVIEFLGKYQPEVFGALGLTTAVQENDTSVQQSTAPNPGLDKLKNVDSSNWGKDPSYKPTAAPRPNMMSTKENMSDQTPEERKAANEYAMGVARAIKSGEVQAQDVEQEFFQTLPMMGVSDEKVMAMWDRMTSSGSEAPREKRTMSDRDIDAELKGMKGAGEDDDANFLASLRSKAKSGSIRQDTTGYGSEVDEAEELDRDEKDRVVEKPSQGGEMKKIAEFIMGFYDRKTGNFPLGETGVKIKVSKEFGDKAGDLAERLIQKLASQGQRDQMFEDIQILSGQKKATTVISESKVKHTSILDSDFADIMKLAGLKK